MEQNFCTMEKLAAESGYSLATVSRALDPSKCKLLKPETTEKIRKIAEKYHYLSNPAARRLSRRKLETITLVLNPGLLRPTPLATPDFDAHYGITYWEIINGIIDEAKKLRYDIKLEPLISQDSEENIKQYVNSAHTDGVIMLYDNYMERLATYIDSHGVPLVILERSMSSRGRTMFRSVSVNPETGIDEGLDHLIAKGHKKIACVFFTGVSASREKLDFFKSHLEKINMFDPALTYEVQNDFELRALLNSFKGKFPFTAMFCANDSGADRAVRELRFSGYKVPEDVAVFGYDNNRVYTGKQGTNPSTVDWQRARAGAEAVKMLIKIIENKSFKPAKEVMINSKFIAGKTT